MRIVKSLASRAGRMPTMDASGRVAHLRIPMDWLFALPMRFGGGTDSPANNARSISARLLILYLTPLSVLFFQTTGYRQKITSCRGGKRVPTIKRITINTANSTLFPLVTFMNLFQGSVK